jgi:hypothetical protein
VAASAILVVGTRSLLSPEGDESFSADGAEPPASPIASLEILGQSIVEHTIARLHSAGINTVSVVHEVGFSLTAGWRFVPDVLMKQARKGFEKVLLIRLGAYAEVDCADLLKFHSESGAGVTRVCDASGPLDFWVLDSAPARRSRLNLDSHWEINPPSDYLTRGYVNRLEDARDLRRLVADAFQGRCAIRPRGREIKPGVWIDDGARIHRSARIVAPAYIGRGTRVRAAALVTRFTNLERRCLVDYGTAIEDSSVLPYTHVGRGLDLVHAVVEGSRLVNLSHNVAVTIRDASLLGPTVSRRHWFGYGRKKAAVAVPITEAFEIESVVHAAARPRTVLRILSKGEV